MAVALDAPERHRHTVEPLIESVFQLARGLPIKPGGQCVGQDRGLGRAGRGCQRLEAVAQILRQEELIANAVRFHRRHLRSRSEEHTSELQSLMRSAYAVFCLKKKNK